MSASSFEEELCDVICNDSFIKEQQQHQEHKKGVSAHFKRELQKQIDQSCIEISAWCGEILNEDVSPDILTSLRDGTVLCKVAATLYPNNPPATWIPDPHEYMDYNINLSIFCDHCAAIGIDSSLIGDYTVFDDRDLPRLTTYLFEYIDYYNKSYDNSLQSYTKDSNDQNPPQSSDIQPSIQNTTDYNLNTQNNGLLESNLTESLIDNVPQEDKPKKKYFCCFFLRD